MQAKSLYHNTIFDQALNKLTDKYIRTADVDPAFLIEMLPIHPQSEDIAKTLENIGTPEALV